MPNRFRRSFFLTGSLIAVVASLNYAHARGQASPTPDNSTNATSHGFSRGDLMRLRPVLLRDLIPSLKIVYNDPSPSFDDINTAFLSCDFTPLRLGKLGSAILVEWKGNGGVNVPLLNIYIPSVNSYRKIIDSGGFGPGIVPRRGSPVPDLLFGATSGSCHATINRYRYIRGRYRLDACDQEEGASGETCAVKSCKDRAHPHPLPTFPDPASWSGPPNTPAPYFDGPTLTAKQILSEKH